MRTTCYYCGAYIKSIPEQGSDPDDADHHWWEEYECENGHTGRIEWYADKGTSTSGALTKEEDIIA